MKHIIIIMTIFYLSGCDNASAWQTSPKNWDYDQELVKTIKNANWVNVYAILYPLTSNKKINDALIYRLKKDLLYAIENKIYSFPEEWDEQLESDCKHWTDFSQVKDAKIDGVCENEEGFGEYLMDFVERVSNIYDPKIIEPIIDSLAIMSGNQISDSLAKYGDKAIKALIKKYRETQDENLQSNILFTIDRILQKNASVLSNNNEELKVLLLKALINSDPFVRESAIDTLISLGDSSVIPVLEEIAKNDNYVIRRGKKVIYRVRDKAQKAIEELKGKPRAKARS